MKQSKEKKKGGFNPKKSELKRVHLFFVSTLEPEEREKIMYQSLRFAKEHNRKLYQNFQNNPTPYIDGKWFSYGIKKVLNIKAGRTTRDHRPAELTLDNLREIAKYLRIDIGQSEKIKKSVFWSLIVAKVKQDEDSTINRLTKLWNWLEERLTVGDIEYLLKNSPGHWKDEKCYKDSDWRKKHLSHIFDISFTIQSVVSAKMRADKRMYTVFGLSRIQLWVITHKIMGLNLPASATKEVMWQGILEKIAFDKE